jgi:hypothetical protein
MRGKVTRRQLAKTLATPAVALAQKSGGQDLNLLARSETRRWSDAMAKVKVPMSAEPAVHFKA